MSVIARRANRAALAIEGATVLDAPAEALHGIVSRLGPGRLKDALSGVAAAHPLHPVLVTVPVGALVGLAYLDATGGDPGTARRLLGLGLLASPVAIASGLVDWSDTDGPERRVGLAHLVANSAGLALVAASWVARANGARPKRAVTSSVAGLALMGVGGWLGGHLAYALGVGVDTTAFLRPPMEWTDVVAETDLVDGVPVSVTVDQTPVLVVRDRGRVLALGDRCTHRGGPLHESPVRDGCVECPWHGSRFEVTDGSVARGPATRPAAIFQTRVVDGRVQVRSDETRTLRLNPVV